MKNKSNSIESLKKKGLITTWDKLPPNHPDTFDKGGYVKEQYNPLRFISPKPENYEGKILDQTKVNDEYGQFGHISTKTSWITEIENYCSIAGILPEDLIKCHKEAQGGIKKKKLSKDQQMVKDAFKAAKNDHSKWNEQYKNRKLGL